MYNNLENKKKRIVMLECYALLQDKKKTYQDIINDPELGLQVLIDLLATFPNLFTEKELVELKTVIIKKLIETPVSEN